MNTTATVSAKYQVVIPKQWRRSLGIEPGQKIHFRKNSRGELVLGRNTIVDELYGSMKGAWGPDSDKYLRDLRDDWNR